MVIPTVTDKCRRVKGTWFCFNGGSSYSGYGQAGFDRRFRVFHVEQYGEKVTTWKHTTFAPFSASLAIVQSIHV